MVSIQQAANSVTQSARQQWDNLSRSDQAVGSRGLRDSIDSLIRTMFAPCAGDIGGVPRDEVFDARVVSSSPATQSPLVRKQSKQSAATPATVPFEVSASSSSLSRSSPTPNTAAPFRKESLSKLRRLGAQHQLASGLHSESLAEVARPSSPDKSTTPDLVDFDDGISAISSHTLEEMERRRAEGPLVTSVKSALKERLNGPIIEDAEWKPKFSTEFEPFSAAPLEIARKDSVSTRRTNATEESFRNFMADEAKYWEGEVNKDRSRRSERPSMEERARRLRELSRSRSRSDGTGSVSYLVALSLYLRNFGSRYYLFYCSLCSPTSPSPHLWQAIRTIRSPSFPRTSLERLDPNPKRMFREVLTITIPLRRWIMERYEL
jgi:hypothetical protein